MKKSSYDIIIVESKAFSNIVKLAIFQHLSRMGCCLFTESTVLSHLKAVSNERDDQK